MNVETILPLLGEMRWEDLQTYITWEREVDAEKLAEYYEERDHNVEFSLFPGKKTGSVHVFDEIGLAKLVSLANEFQPLAEIYVEGEVDLPLLKTVLGRGAILWKDDGHTIMKVATIDTISQDEIEAMFKELEVDRPAGLKQHFPTNVHAMGGNDIHVEVIGGSELLSAFTFIDQKASLVSVFSGFTFTFD